MPPKPLVAFACLVSAPPLPCMPSNLLSPVVPRPALSRLPRVTEALAALVACSASTISSGASCLPDGSTVCARRLLCLSFRLASASASSSEYSISSGGGSCPSIAQPGPVPVSTMTSACSTGFAAIRDASWPKRQMDKADCLTACRIRIPHHDYHSHRSPGVMPVESTEWRDSSNAREGRTASSLA